jgi:hypothetical protein
MLHRRVVALLVAVAFAAAPAAAAESEPVAKPKKPSISVRATPGMSFSPARISFLAELRGGSNDYADFYCATVEWDWGDGTRSEFAADCEPYERGSSEIRRRFITEHRFETAGDYRVQFRLKQGNKVVGSGSTTVRVRPGAQDIGIGG